MYFNRQAGCYIFISIIVFWIILIIVQCNIIYHISNDRVHCKEYAGKIINVTAIRNTNYTSVRVQVYSKDTIHKHPLIVIADLIFKLNRQQMDKYRIEYLYKANLPLSIYRQCGIFEHGEFKLDEQYRHTYWYPFLITVIFLMSLIVIVSFYCICVCWECPINHTDMYELNV